MTIHGPVDEPDAEERPAAQEVDPAADAEQHGHELVEWQQEQVVEPRLVAARDALLVDPVLQAADRTAEQAARVGEEGRVLGDEDRPEDHRRGHPDARVPAQADQRADDREHGERADQDRVARVDVDLTPQEDVLEAARDQRQRDRADQDRDVRDRRERPARPLADPEGAQDQPPDVA
jgi:hypothetical protein